LAAARAMPRSLSLLPRRSRKALTNVSDPEVDAGTSNQISRAWSPATIADAFCCRRGQFPGQLRHHPGKHGSFRPVRETGRRNETVSELLVRISQEGHYARGRDVENQDAMVVGGSDCSGRRCGGLFTVPLSYGMSLSWRFSRLTICPRGIYHARKTLRTWTDEESGSPGARHTGSKS
jgi:hypothetical protein